jgi:prolipoprotein diacylglyceryl transferase
VPLLAYIPSPSRGVVDLGPLPIRAYGLCIALGVYAAVTVAARRFQRRGGDPELITVIAVWSVPAGIVGARIYHVATDYELYTHHWLNAFKIWDGGLGIWGAVLAGVLVGVRVVRRRGGDARLLMDVVAPALPLAQAIGRYGNWFNQELFGRPSGLPWALHIDLAHRPAGFQQFSTFQPTFLYESLWDLTVVGIVLLVERRVRLKPGRLFAVYVAAYTFGRFWVESLRIDFAHRFLGLRLNDWTSIVIFLVAMGFVITGIERETTEGDTLSPDVDPELATARVTVPDDRSEHTSPGNSAGSTATTAAPLTAVGTKPAAEPAGGTDDEPHIDTTAEPAAGTSAEPAATEQAAATSTEPTAPTAEPAVTAESGATAGQAAASAGATTLEPAATTTEPATPEPTAAGPATTEPATPAGPATTEPATPAEPATTEPATPAEPTAAEPATTEPAAPEPTAAAGEVAVDPAETNADLPAETAETAENAAAAEIGAVADPGPTASDP